MNKKFNSVWPQYSKEEIKSVSSVLKSGNVNYWTGRFCLLFEKNFSKYHKIKYCVSVNSGTSALDCAIKSLNLKKGSEIMTTPRSYYTSAASIVNAGMKPRFIDISKNSQNIDPQIFEEMITKKTKALICVHLSGVPCEMDKIIKIAKKYKIFVIEDCSQAHGAKINNKKVGSFGDLAIWSFCQDKIISTGGEGGMVGTNSSIYYKKILSLKDNGRNFEKLKKISYKGTFNYIHDYIGNNYRMTEIQAMLGLIQLKKLDITIKKRNLNADIFNSNFKNLNQIFLLDKDKNITKSYYRYYLFVKKKQNQKILINNLRSKGIECLAGSCPEIYLEKFFKSNFSFKRLANAKFIGERSISLKIDQTMSIKIIKEHAKIIKREINKLD